MKDVHLISLSGQGDEEAYLVSKEVFDWVVNRDTPGRAGNEHAWRDTATPEAIRNAIREENQRYGDSDSDLANCTIGSYNNDRALYAGRAAIAGGYGDTERDMVEYAHANGLRIVDEFRGYIY